MKPFAIGEKIQWKWMGRSIKGLIIEIHLLPVSKTIKGKSIKRNGSQENPAYLVQSEVGNLALKLHSELEPSESKAATASRPKMFRT